MINLPFISLPEHFTKLLVSNIVNSTQNNTNLELYINSNHELNALVRKIFRDIDPDGFLGKILSISGWHGIRNRLAAVYIEYSMTNRFPETANLSLVNDLITIENKLRHFTPQGYSRAFLLAFYAKMTLIQAKKNGKNSGMTPLIIKDEHIELMKYSKAKSIRIDWLILELILFDKLLGTERLENLLKCSSRYETIYTLLEEREQRLMVGNLMTYGSSINDSDIFLTDLSLQS